MDQDRFDEMEASQNEMSEKLISQSKIQTTIIDQID